MYSGQSNQVFGSYDSPLGNVSAQPCMCVVGVTTMLRARRTAPCIVYWRCSEIDLVSFPFDHKAERKRQSWWWFVTPRRRFTKLCYLSSPLCIGYPMSLPKMIPGTRYPTAHGRANHYRYLGCAHTNRFITARADTICRRRTRWCKAKERQSTSRLSRCGQKPGASIPSRDDAPRRALSGVAKSAGRRAHRTCQVLSTVHPSPGDDFSHNVIPSPHLRKNER